VSKKQEVVDVMFANIKHAFFQPCEHEVLVLVHFFLRNPILIGKKKTAHVQYYTEVVEASQNLDQLRRNSYDPDELEEEQRERALRRRLNDMFKDFCKRVEEIARKHQAVVEFDRPYRELGFFGVANREMVLVQPTVQCLVCLTDTPFFLVELDQIEHVHFERCDFKNKNFDIVFVGKDLEKLPSLVSSVQMSELDSIQEWLTDLGITYTVGVLPINWKLCLSTIRTDPRFYFDTDEDGEPRPPGWTFLEAGGDGSDGEGSDDGNDQDYESQSSVSSESASDFDADSSESGDDGGDDDDEVSDDDDESG
jgi:nucleosome binding factor SPN SPT16 subunit